MNKPGLSQSNNKGIMNSQNKKFDIKSLLLGVALGAGVVLSIAAATESREHTTWEYKVVVGTVLSNDGKLEDALNSSAAQGWDFVSASPSKDQYGFAVMRREKK